MVDFKMAVAKSMNIYEMYDSTWFVYLNQVTVSSKNVLF